MHCIAKVAENKIGLEDLVGLTLNLACKNTYNYQRAVSKICHGKVVNYLCLFLL